jgi:hypothetical protein
MPRAFTTNRTDDTFSNSFFGLTKEQMISRRPRMVRPSPIAAQPQFTLDAAHVKALGKGIVRVAALKR